MQIPSKKKRGRRIQRYRLAGLGVELLGAILGFTLFGLWIDRHYETEPWGVLVCVTCGFIGGFYNLFRSSLKAFRSAVPDDKKQDHGSGS